MTAPNESIRIGISVISDTPGTAKARKELGDVRKQIDELKAAFSRGDKSAEEFTKELARLEKQEKTLKGAIDRVTGEFTAETSAMKAATVEARKLAAEKERLAKAEAKSAALTSAERLGQLGRDIRHLPSVRVPGLGVGTDTFGRAAEVLGRVGIGFEQVAVGGAATAIAIGVVAVAFKEFADAAKKQAAELTAVVEARRDVGQDIAGGLTSEDAQKRLEEINRLREKEQELLNETSQALKDAQKETSVANLLGGDFETTQGSRFLSGLIPQVAALEDQVDKGTAAVAAYDAETVALTTALEDGTLAANDTAKAEADLAAQRIANILQEASQAGELASLRERAADLTKEQIDSELEALERRKVGIEAELASLESSGDTSEEVSKKIAQLKEQLGFLGEQADVLNKAKPGAKSSEAEKAAEKAAKDAEREQERAAKDAQKRLDDVAKAQQNYSDKLADARTAFRDAIADIHQGLQDNLADNNQKLLDDLNESAIEFHQDQMSEERQFRRDLAQISRDADREERDAVRARDFAALAAAREREQDALSDRRREEDAENAEQLDDFRQQREALGRERDIANRDAVIDAERARRDAKTDRDRAYRDARIDRERSLRDVNALEQTYQRSSINQWQNYYTQLASMQRSALGGISRPTGESARGAGSSRVPSNDDLMNFVMTNPR